MKQLEEEFGPDRMIGTETDDEENQAQRVLLNHDDNDTDSDISNPPEDNSSDFLDNGPSPCWPQSYRQSMDMYTNMTPPSISFLRGSSFLASSADKRSQPSDTEASLTKPLIHTTNLDTQVLPISTVPSKESITSHLTSSLNELPPPQQCSFSQSVLNAVNALCGIGILSTPYALKEGGWFSILLLFIFGAITCYTGILLKRCLESSSNLETYPDIGQAAFGLSGRIFIATILYIELYSSCVELLIMMSDNLSAFFPNAQMEFAGIHLDSYQICAITATLVILPTVWLRNLRLLSYVSVGGVVTLALVVICLLRVVVISEIGFHPSGKALDLTRLPITIGIYSFCYGSHSVFPNIYSSMKEPSRFPTVLIISFVIAVSLYAGIAVCGFLMFGEATNPQFTLNLPTNLVTSKVAGWAVVVAPLTKFGLTITPVALALEELLPLGNLTSHGVSILIRTSLVVSILVVALTVPYFGSVMAFIGSFLVMLVSVVLPCACYMRIDRGRLTTLQISSCALIMVVGVCCAIIGTYSALKSMAQ